MSDLEKIPPFDAEGFLRRVWPKALTEPEGGTRELFKTLTSIAYRDGQINVLERYKSEKETGKYLLSELRHQIRVNRKWRAVSLVQFLIFGAATFANLWRYISL